MVIQAKKTINVSDNEIRQIAQHCNNSDEFTNRMKSVIGCEFDDNTLCRLRKTFNVVKHELNCETAWSKYITIMGLLKQRADVKGLWYETWVDLEEAWEDKWFTAFQYMGDNDIVEVCAKYLNDRERFYGSSDYTDMLNGMIKKL